MNTTQKIATFVILFVVATLVLLQMAHNRVYRFARELRQRAQLHSIDAALELFVDEFGRYPPSDANDPAGEPYCGVMKLHEAMYGRDNLGFHKDSVFHREGCDPNDRPLYSLAPIDPAYEGNLEERKGPYLPLDNADSYELQQIYGSHTGDFRPASRLICDFFPRRNRIGGRISMPILYYRADPNGTLHDGDNPDNPANIYDYRDNQALLELGVPGKPKKKHPLADPKVFYEMTTDPNSGKLKLPYNPKSFILISAGRDGLYGTRDDIVNIRRY